MKTLLQSFIMIAVTTLALPLWAQTSENPLFQDSDEDMEIKTKKRSSLIETEAERKLRLRSIVKSATKSEVSVQEAPAVVTVITEDDIKDYGFRHLFNLLSYVPSILPANRQYDNFPLITCLGITQNTQLVQDGVSLLDPVFNVQATPRRLPIELYKRVEQMNSPGGLLWGANSFLGITSITTKDAEDVKGVEMGVSGGTGPGDQDIFRSYLMFGKVFSNNFKVFVHGSGEFFRGPKFEYLPVSLYAPSPQPLAPVIYGAGKEYSSSVPMNFYGTFDGKITYKKAALHWYIPFIGFPGFRQNIARAGTFTSWAVDDSSRVKELKTNNINSLDRYVLLKYSDHEKDAALGFDAKLYFTQFIREFNPTIILPASNAVEGLAFKTDARGYRTGINLDFTWKLGSRTKMLFGAESFYEWIKNSQVSFVAPLDANGNLNFNAVPLSCPFYDTSGNGISIYDPEHPERTNFVPGCRQAFIYDTDRLVAGTFAMLSHKFTNRVIIDGGLRVQMAPAGNATYDPVLIPGASLVVPLSQTWFIKANYLTGFRPPIFNDLGSNGRAVVFASDRNLKVETSQSFQGELNGILIKNRGKIQELSFRLNYGFSIVDNIIRIANGQYYNADRRNIHAVEAFIRLYMRGGHSMMFGYSFNTQWAQGNQDGMIFRSIPNQWFTIASNLKVTKKFDLIAGLRVIGSFEDPNRIMNPTTLGAQASMVAYEQVPSAGILTLGMRYRTSIARFPTEFSAFIYNITDSQYYNGDYFNDVTAQTETVPTRAQRFHFMLNTKINF